MGSSFNKSFLIVGSAKLINAALIFLRMAILARLLSPVDFGVAATFWITTGILAAITEIGIDKMLIQDKEGATERFGAVAQTLFFIRGAIIALSILLLAPLLSVFFDIPHAASDFAMLAVLPLLKGLEHRSYIQKQRKMEFVPLATLQISPDLISLILAYPLAAYFQDYRAFVFLSIASGLISLIVSHLVSDKKINYCWDRELIKKMLRFGWPLSISSVLLMLTLQGDKLIISQFYSKYELGLYAVAFSFATFMPNNLGGVVVQIVLPYLSRIRDDAGRLLLRVRYLNQLVLWITLAGIFVLMTLSRQLIDLFYGNKYSDINEIAIVLIIVFFIRLVRQVPNTLCIVFGETKSVMYSNALRQIVLLGTIAISAMGLELYWVAAVGLIGEYVAMVSISRSIRRTHDCESSYWPRAAFLLTIYSSLVFMLAGILNQLDSRLPLYIIVAAVLTLSSFNIYKAFRLLNAS